MSEETPWGLPLPDLDESVDASAADLEHWRGARILVTGGTGALGSWLVGSLLRADERLKLDIALVLVTRNAGAVPLAASKTISFIEADVRELPDVGSVDLVIHGAASSSVGYGQGDGEPRSMAATIVDGTRSAIAIATRSHARLLFLSSGAVYGPQFAPVGEATLTAPDSLDPRSSYGLAKRLGEVLIAAATEAGDLDGVIARLFAFVGPRLPLDAHYAVGNFMGDLLSQRSIRIGGDGRPMRSYLYSGELPEWCWAIASRGGSKAAYNVGSPESVSIFDLATRIAAMSANPLAVEIAGTPSSDPAPWYVPDVDLAASELGLQPRNDLSEALRKYRNWHTGS